MHGRKPLALAMGLVLSLAGCQSGPGARLFGGKKDDDAVLKPSTYVSFADYRAQCGFAKDLPESARLQSREEARLSYLKAIEVDEKCLPAHLGLARLLTHWERHGEAAESYRKAIALSPADGGLWYELGMCQCRQKEWGPAAESLARAVELAPQQQAYKAHLGLALARGGRHAEALANLKEAVGEAQANYDLARLCEHMKQPALARHYAHAALRADPKLAGARAMLKPPAKLRPAVERPEVRTVSHQTTEAEPLPKIITPRGDGAAPKPLPPEVTDGAATMSQPGAAPIPVPPPVVKGRGR